MKKKFEYNKDNKKTTTFSKVIVFLCLINGIFWVWCSYILAFLDKGQIAESLSQLAITEIVAVILTYSVKALFENISKNTEWPSKNKISSNVNINENDSQFNTTSIADPITQNAEQEAVG